MFTFSAADRCTQEKRPARAGQGSQEDAETLQDLGDDEDSGTSSSQQTDERAAVGLSSSDRRGHGFGQCGVSRGDEGQDTSGTDAANDLLVHEEPFSGAG